MIERLIREDLQHFAPYASARGEHVSGEVWLNANELPWGEAATVTLSPLNRYPQQQPEALQKALAAYHQVDTGQLLITRGSDEGIDLLVRLFCQAGKDAVAACQPTFGMYRVSASLQGVRYLTFPLSAESGYGLDAEQLLQHWDPATKVLFLCSPNNPTGNLLQREQILKLCTALTERCLVVVDEAYIEFAGQPGLVAALPDYENLVVLRTMSKAFGLAAARVGVLLAQTPLIQWISKIMPPYPVATPAAQLALEALQPRRLEALQAGISRIVASRQWLQTRLENLACVQTVWPSDANFLLVTFQQPVMQHCLHHGVVIRAMDKLMGCPRTYRISVGTPQENQRLIEVLAQLQE